MTKLSLYTKELRPFALAAGCLLFAETAFPQAYTVNGHGGKIADGDILYLTYRVEKDVHVDSTVASGGAFTFKGTQPKPLKATLYRNQNPMRTDRVDESLALYLEPGTVTIESPDNLTNARTGGTPLNETQQLLRVRLRPLVDQIRAIKDPDDFSEAEKNDTALVRSTERRLTALYEARVLAELTFAKEHPGSYVSLQLLERNSWQGRFADQTEAAYLSLSDALKKMPEAETVRKNIEKSRLALPGTMAKDFTLPDVTGKKVSLASHRGKYVLVDFWASWCGPCRQENPNVVAAYEAYKDKGFAILGVSMDQNRENWLKAIEKDQLTWTHVSDLKGGKGEVAQLYGITSIPSNVLVDPKGKIVAKDLRGEALQAELAKWLEKK